jgi:hypothetical protein
MSSLNSCLKVAWNFSASQFLLFVNPFAHTEWTNPTSTSPPYNADAATAASTPREACTKKFTERSMSLIYETATNIPVPLLKNHGSGRESYQPPRGSSTKPLLISPNGKKHQDLSYTTHVAQSMYDTGGIPFPTIYCIENFSATAHESRCRAMGTFSITSSPSRKRRLHLERSKPCL